MSFPYQPSFRYGTHTVGTTANGEAKVEKGTETGRTSERESTPREWFAYTVSRLYDVTQFRVGGG